MSLIRSLGSSVSFSFLADLLTNEFLICDKKYLYRLIFTRVKERNQYFSIFIYIKKTLHFF